MGALLPIWGNTNDCYCLGINRCIDRLPVIEESKYNNQTILSP
jgi:hypothetical protein